MVCHGSSSVSQRIKLYYKAAGWEVQWRHAKIQTMDRYHNLPDTLRDLCFVSRQVVQGIQASCESKATTGRDCRRSPVGHIPRVTERN